MKEFEKIAEEAIRKAGDVDCSFEDFVTGLKDILDAVQERWELANAELSERERR